MPTVALDFDDTLVGYKKYGEPGEWLPGALEGLIGLLKSGRKVVIFSCRANWVEGLAEIVAKLRAHPFLARALDRGDLKVWVEEGKPPAALYVDDRGFRFEGSWDGLLATLKELSRG